MRHLGRACLLIALSGAGLNAVATPAPGGDPAGEHAPAEALPSIELLEYLAEFEDAADGALLDPVDLPQRTSSDDAAQDADSWSKHR